MNTRHRFYFEDSSRMAALEAASVDLVVTSPPYPMVAMWDDLFCAWDAAVARAMREEDGPAAFECMHVALDAVWREVLRVTKPGGIVCVNIGDATRTLAGNFALYANHARILGYLLSIGFSALPSILWRKQTNAPNKFMGSGLWPPGAYVTLEHEYILILRKGAGRRFSSPAEKADRRRSAFFWEERNVWYSDVWTDLKGIRQALGDPVPRSRSAAFPFELPYRLINMFSVNQDVVLDPFAGIGTTAAAALAAGRNSIGYELNRDFMPTITAGMNAAKAVANARIRRRLGDHVNFVADRYMQKGPFRYRNVHYGFPVVTRQELELLLNDTLTVEWLSEHDLRARYREAPQRDFCRDWHPFFEQDPKTRCQRLKPAGRSNAVQAALPGFAFESGK